MKGPDPLPGFNVNALWQVLQEGQQALANDHPIGDEWHQDEGW
jgi:hypothetical protein